MLLAPKRLADNVANAHLLCRRLPTHSDTLRRRLLLTLCRPLLHAHLQRLAPVVELCPQNILHRHVVVHRLHHDADLCANSRAREGGQIRHVRFGRQSYLDASDDSDLSEVAPFHFGGGRFPVISGSSSASRILSSSRIPLPFPRDENLLTRFSQNLWVFSIILESVCVLPQLMLLRQTTVPTVIDSFYLVTLGSYRGFYILNWLVRGFGPEHNFDPVRTIYGIVQTALYIDFAWVYWTRQRVKLRGGGVVDSDDLSRGWLVGRFLGRKSTEADRDDYEYDAEAGGDDAQPRTRNNSKWGARGISVSADDTLDPSGEASQPLADPAAFEDEESDDDADATNKKNQARASGQHEREHDHESGVSNGVEWREDRD